MTWPWCNCIRHDTRVIPETWDAVTALTNFCGVMGVYVTWKYLVQNCYKSDVYFNSTEIPIDSLRLFFSDLASIEFGAKWNGWELFIRKLYMA